MTVATEKMTCKLVLVTPGSSDRVMKVFPSNGKEEKIWLDTVHGIERWDEVKRFLYNHAVRGTRVPDPQPYCADPYDLKSRTLSEADIPMCTLEEGFVFEVFKEPAPRVTANPMPVGTAEGVNSRIDALEARIGNIAASVEKVVAALGKR